MYGKAWPPPKVLTLMDESVRSSSERVPTCVGCNLPGGGLLVYLGSQSIALAEVSCSAIVSGEEGSCKIRDEDASEA